jgi:hypothetical protein
MGSKGPTADIPVAMVHAVPAGPLATKHIWVRWWLWSQVRWDQATLVAVAVAAVVHAVVPATKEEGAAVDVVVAAPRVGPTSLMPGRRTLPPSWSAEADQMSWSRNNQAGGVAIW